MQNQNLCRLRIVVGRFFVIWLWAHVAVLALVGLANGSHWLAATATGAAAAGIATAAWLYDREGPLARYAIAIAQVMMVSFNQSESNLRELLSHQLCSVISDGVYVKGRPHPRLYGTFASLLGDISRERGWLSLSEAVHRITARPAARFNIAGRGRLTPGFHADLVLFDPLTVAGPASYDAPTTPPTGIRMVLLNGRRIVPV